jgi:hypothetical protein
LLLLLVLLLLLRRYVLLLLLRLLLLLLSPKAVAEAVVEVESAGEDSENDDAVVASATVMQITAIRRFSDQGKPVGRPIPVWPPIAESGFFHFHSRNEWLMRLLSGKRASDRAMAHTLIMETLKTSLRKARHGEVAESLDIEVAKPCKRRRVHIPTGSVIEVRVPAHPDSEQMHVIKMMNTLRPIMLEFSQPTIQWLLKFALGEERVAPAKLAVGTNAEVTLSPQKGVYYSRRDSAWLCLHGSTVKHFKVSPLRPDGSPMPPDAYDFALAAGRSQANEELRRTMRTYARTYELCCHVRRCPCCGWCCCAWRAVAAAVASSLLLLSPMLRCYLRARIVAATVLLLLLSRLLLLLLLQLSLLVRSCRCAEASEFAGCS